MKKIVITGGTGFLGSRIISRYRDKYEIISATSDKLDIANEAEVYKLINDEKPDIIIHAAAVAETKFCDENVEIAYNLNVKGAANIAKACESIKSRLVFFSTEQIFNGNTNLGPFNEGDIPVPNTQYGKTKFEAEKEVMGILSEAWILRLTWLFGLPERNLKMNPNILWDTLSNAYLHQTQKVPVHEYRGMTYVYDLVDQFEKIFDIEYGTYHVGSQNNLSRYEITRHVLETVGMRGDKIEELLIADTEKYSQKSRDVRLNTDKIKSKGFVFEDSKDAIAKCLREFKII